MKGHSDSNNMVVQNIQKQKQSKYETGELKLFHSKPFHPKKKNLNTEYTSIENEYIKLRHLLI